MRHAAITERPAVAQTGQKAWGMNCQPHQQQHEGSASVWATTSHADGARWTQSRLLYVTTALHAWALHHQDMYLTLRATPWSTVIVTHNVDARTSAVGTDGPHLAASVAREQLGNVAAHVWALQRVHKALRVYANGKGCHAGEGTIVLHTLGGALKMQQECYQPSTMYWAAQIGGHGCSLRCAGQRQGLTSGKQQVLCWV